MHTPTPTQSPNHLTLLQTYTNTLQNQNNAKLEQIRLLHEELSNSRQLYNSRLFVTTTMAPLALCSGCEKIKQELEKVREELEIVSRERRREKEEWERGTDGDRGRREFQMVKRELDNANKDYDRVSLANLKLNQDLAELRAEVRRLEGIKRDQKERIVEKVVVKEVESTEIRAAYEKLQLINEQLNKKYETSKEQSRNLQQIHEKSVAQKSQQHQIQIQSLHKYNLQLIQKIQVLQQKLFLFSQTCSIPKMQILDQEKSKSNEKDKDKDKEKVQILSPFQYQFMTQRSSVPGIRINVQVPSAQNSGVEVPAVKVVQNGGVHRHGRSVLVEQAPVKVVYPTFRHLSPAPICSHLSPLSVLTHNQIPPKHESHAHKDTSYINNCMNYYKDLKQQRWRSLQHKIHFLEQQNRQLRSNVITPAYI